MVTIRQTLPGAAAPARAVEKQPSLHRLMRRRSTGAFGMCLPLILIIACLVIYPAFYAIYLAMLNKAQTKFIGLGNFSFLLTRDVFLMVVEQSVILAAP